MLTSTVPPVPPVNFLQARDSIASITTVTSDEDLQVALPPTETPPPASSFLPPPRGAITSDERHEDGTLPVFSARLHRSGSPNGMVASSQVQTTPTTTQTPRIPENHQFTFTTPRPSSGGGLIAFARNILSTFSPWNVQHAQQGGTAWSC